MGAAPTTEAAEAEEEVTSGHTRAGRTTDQETKLKNRAADAAPRYSSQDYVSIYEFTSGNMSFGSYPIKRNATPAKQGRAGHSGMYGFSQTPPSGASKSLPAQLASNHSRRVGAEHRARTQDRIPEASLSEGETTPIVLHREGRGVHAGRDPKHARQAGHISDRGDS